MASRNDYLLAQRSTAKSLSRIASSSKIEDPGRDSAAISQSANLKSKALLDKSYIQNLQSTRSFLKFQEEGYRNVFKIYQRIEEISRESLLQPKSYKNPYNEEFQELKKELIQIKNSKFNGIAIFDPVATCGEIVDIPVEGSALDYTKKEPGVLQTIRGKSLDVKAYGGKLSFSVNSGNAGEIYRVFMGQTQIFSTGPSFTGDPRQVVINRTSSGSDPNEDDAFNPVLQSNIQNSDSWRTSGSASDGDIDRITLEFGPGVKTTYQVELGNSNASMPYNDPTSATQQVLLKENGGKIRIAHLNSKSSETQLSIHVETKSIGVISDVEFVPKFFDTNVDIDGTGNQVTLKAIGVETFENFSIDTPAGAKVLSDKLLGKNGHTSELDCIGHNWLPKIAASINRVDSEIENANLKTNNYSIALGRIEGSDIARDVTDNARGLISKSMSAIVMGKAARINEILSPLTTEHHRSSIINGSALL